MLPIPFVKKEEKKEEKELPRIVMITPDILARFVDPNPFLEQVEAYLRGQILIRKADGYERRQIGKPRMSEEGIQEVLKIMRMRLGEIYRMPNLDNSFIRWETYFFNLNLAELLAKKAKDWEMDGAYYQELVDFLVSSYEAVMRMALLHRFIVEKRPEFEL